MAQPAIGHAFADPELLNRALTHRSLGARNNERLEFLGDAVLNLIAAEALYLRWPRSAEGTLTRSRAALVRESTLAELARGLDLGGHILLGPGELKSGGHRRDSILADALEAVIGAIYLDGGYSICRERVLEWLQPKLDSPEPGSVGKDAKTRLQELLQARQLALPEYDLVDARGEEHDRWFTARCRVLGLDLEFDGEGGSRREAEQAAATTMLEHIEGQT